jgi:hypothetical protein
VQGPDPGGAGAGEDVPPQQQPGHSAQHRPGRAQERSCQVRRSFFLYLIWISVVRGAGLRIRIDLMRIRIHIRNQHVF